MALLWVLLLLGCWPVARAEAAAATLRWDSGGGSTARFQIQRCLAPTGQSECVPSADLPGASVPATVTTYIDQTPEAGKGYCWSVWAILTDQSRLQVLPGPDGKRYVCQASALVLPLAGPITLTPQGASLLVQWSLPTFTSATVPASALTGFAVWRRPEPVPPGEGWKVVTSVGPTVTTWEDTAPAKPQGCYQIRALYGTLGFVDNATVCGAAPVFVPGPVVPPAPTNLRFAP
jgi:hypothetical protein